MGDVNRLPTDLEKRLRAHRRFHLSRGMTLLTHDGLMLQRPISGAKDWDDDPHVFPMLDDDATAGCLLAMLPASGAVAWRDGRRHISAGPPTATGATLGEACAEALLAVWGAP